MKISTDYNLRLLYVQLREGQVARTERLLNGMAFADFDEEGRLLGVEFFEPGEQLLELERLVSGYC